MTRLTPTLSTLLAITILSCQPPETREYQVPMVIYVPWIPPWHVAPANTTEEEPTICPEPWEVSCDRYWETYPFLSACSFGNYCQAHASGGFCPAGLEPIMRLGKIGRPDNCIDTSLPMCAPYFTPDGAYTTKMGCCTPDGSPIQVPTCTTAADCAPPSGECTVMYCDQFSAEDPTPNDGSGFCRIDAVSAGTPCKGGNGECVNGVCVVL